MTAIINYFIETEKQHVSDTEEIFRNELVSESDNENANVDETVVAPKINCTCKSACK